MGVRPRAIPRDDSDEENRMKEDQSTAPADQPIPPSLADSIQSAFDEEERPSTLDDWVTVITRLLDEADISVGVEELCTASESRHVAGIDGTDRHFHCVLDTLVLPFLRPEASPLAVRSRSPDGDDMIELTVSPETIEVTPAEAVMSFGHADGLDVPDPDDIDPALAYRSICPYINAFPTRAAYERWAEETPDAATMAISFPQGLELARALADRPQYETG